ncbi:hypothetical protein CFC21_084422 [Triticum aestivum]|uniref:Uncharacterized protein n=3 Tax=Triticum TaxID=4564 RepID=A0A9R0Y7A3_TRITD|nr:uncharacterized protein LOC119317814 [Triticum dicoccoides]XP_044404247.1 uncharacterized protein LOC123128339 [Triticum aestivum]KAF7080324.1 hypothetical protein CFC21_084422 [Triticum aestivum]VAI49238.1 unnamed protein product [Triticum turgidum subsp. durum]
MSLALLGGYSSAEDDDPAAGAGAELSDSGDSSAEEAGSDGDEKSAPSKPAAKPRPRVNPSPGDGDSSLPSALDVFAEISGPPAFLNRRVAQPEEVGEALGVLDHRSDSKRRKPPPPGAVVAAKPQMVAIRERVSSDVKNGANPPVAVVSAKPQLVAGHERVTSDTKNGANPPGSVEGKRKIGAANPGPEDAAELLRMCLQCGIPKTYSHAQGMVCPVCNDRPVQAKEPEKKKGSAVKDKEKVKRMRGQSSHASWKSETEMALRQQFD